MELTNLAKIFKALSNKQRLAIFHMIYMGIKTCPGAENPHNCHQGMEKSFTKACQCFNLSRSTISHHLKELQNSGLITCHKRGQANICDINEDVIQAVKDLFT